MKGLSYLCGALEKMCHLQVSLSSQASDTIVTRKRRTRHLQVTDDLESSNKVFRRLEKNIFAPKKNYHRKVLYAKEA